MSLSSSTSSIAAGRRVEIDEADAIRNALRARVRDVFARTNGAERTLQVSVPVPTAVRPLDWLRAQSGADAAADAVYWNGRDDVVSQAGIGRADVVSSRNAPADFTRLHDRLQKRLDAMDAPVRYYGGVRFDALQDAVSDRPSDEWLPFGTYRFVLPRFTLSTRGPDAPPMLSCTLCLPRDHIRSELVVDAIDDIVLPKPQPAIPAPGPVGRGDSPNRQRWMEMVRWALDRFDGSDLDKVVFARRVQLAFDKRLDPLMILRQLKSGTPGCFHFAIRPNAGSFFIGASPERLFRRIGSTVESEAVAGTGSRGDSEQADAELHTELLESEKDRREHAYVDDAIRERLAAVCTSVRTPEETSAMTLARGRHLHSQITGTLHPGISSVDLLDLLHPTPAVGGVPTRDAMDAIRAQEPFDRGWYAGPIGWIGPDRAEFAVAIRSGLVRERTLALFSGAGIVNGSIPDAEWDEIEQKIGDFAAVLDIV